MLKSINHPRDPLTVAVLEHKMRDENVSNYVVMFLRLLTSCEIQRRQDFFEPFVMVRIGDFPD
jgi:ubiquitin thioesterase protein OTUB1